MKSFLAALGFLTIFPVPAKFQHSQVGLDRAVTFFPIVGLLIGLSIAGLDYALAFIFPIPVRSVLVIMALLIASRGIHLDGLADTADGILSLRSKEKILEIMRDPRIGSMAVGTVVCVILLKVSSLTALTTVWRWKAIVLIPLAGRCALNIVMASFSYMRVEGGLATAFQKNCSRIQAPWAALFLLGTSWILLSWIGLISAAISILCAFALGYYFCRMIGGYTGDILGAVCEITEIIPVLCLISVLSKQF